MKTLLIHLSDSHIKKVDDPIFHKVESITDTVRTNILDVEEVFVIFSGDIVFSGKKDEYDTALEFIDTLEQSLKKKLAKEKINFVLVPGNHDCDLVRDNKARVILIDNLNKDPKSLDDDDVITGISKLQHDFFNFYDSIIAPKNGDNTIWMNLYELNDKYKINFICLNSAITFSEKSNAGSLFFPIQKLENVLKETRLEGCINIAVVHHNLNWFNHDNSRHLRTILAENTTLVLTGHEHILSATITQPIDGMKTGYIEGGVLQEEKNPEKASFNIIKIDFLDSKVELLQYEWNGKIFFEKKSELSILRNRSLANNKFTINTKFTEWLHDLGNIIKHPAKDQLLLEDIYVFPKLRARGGANTKKKELDECVDSCEVIKQLSTQENIKLLIMGADGSGRTSLAKQIFNELHENDRIPIYIKGSHIDKTSPEAISELIRQSIEACYVQIHSELIFQKEYTKTVIIIDDFDSSPLSHKAKIKFLRDIIVIYPNVIIFADLLFELFKTLRIEDANEHPLHSFCGYEILDFSNKLQYKLVEKWLSVNHNDSEDKEEVDDRLRKIDYYLNNIKIIIGRDLIPSNPLYLLSILQSLELSNPHDLERSTYGGCYQALLTIAIVRETGKEKIESFFTFLGEFAFHIYNQDKNSLTSYDFNNFIKLFIDNYALRLSAREIIDHLTRASVLIQDGDLIKFKYKYIFYFFVAKYLADNMHEAHITKTIKNLFNNLHVAKKANIATFLTYHAKNPIILNLLKEEAKSVFKDKQIVRFESDISAINELIRDIPKMVVDEQDCCKNREKTLERQEKIDEAKEEKKEDEDDLTETNTEDSVSTLDVFAQLNYGAKLIEIIGQVLKGYFGSLKKSDKEALVFEGYNLALRSLKVLLEVICEDRDGIIREISALIKDKKRNLSDEEIKKYKDKLSKEEIESKKRNLSKEEIENISRMFVFDLSAYISHAFIRKTSRCLGTQELAITFEEVRKREETNSFRLINLSIKLDHFRDFPHHEIEDILKHKNNLVFYLTKCLVIDRLYMYPLVYQEKQWVASKLDIKLKSLMNLEAKISNQGKK